MPVNTPSKKNNIPLKTPISQPPRTASPPLSRCPRIAPKTSKIWAIQHRAAAFFPNPANFLSLRRAAAAKSAGCPWQRAPGTASPLPFRLAGRAARRGSRAGLGAARDPLFIPCGKKSERFSVYVRRRCPLVVHGGGGWRGASLEEARGRVLAQIGRATGGLNAVADEWRLLHLAIVLSSFLIFRFVQNNYLN
jgi:hypothetical protein